MSDPIIQSSCIPLSRVANRPCRFRLAGSGFSNPTVTIDDPSSPTGWTCTVQPPIKPGFITVVARLNAAAVQLPVPDDGGTETGQVTVTVTNDDTSQAVLVTDASYVD